MRGSLVLVTGGAGFIGSHVVDRLVAAGHRPRILDTRPSPWHAGVETVIGDVRSLDDVVAASRGCAAICHLAAADVHEVLERPAWATELNAMGTLVAVYVIAVIVAGLQQIGVPFWAEYIVYGVALAGGVALSGKLTALREQRARRDQLRAFEESRKEAAPVIMVR